MPFEKFVHKGGRAKYSFPVLTIQASGGMVLNDLAHDLLGRPERVVLLYDRDEKLIGLQPASKVDKTYSFPIRNSGLPGYDPIWALSAKSFCNYYGVDTEVTRRYLVKGKDELFVVDLKDPIAALKPRKKGQRVQ
jgi:hypothetical protein